MMLLRANGLAIGFRRRRQQRLVAGNISFDITAGEIICLLGPNGAGKTTLLRTLLGLQPLLSGQVELAGGNLATMARQAIARHIAFVPQAVDPVFDFTVQEMVLMGRTAHLGALGQPGKEDYLCATDALEQLGIGALAARRFATLSGGQQQLVLIARALAQDSNLIALDEPASSLDLGHQAQLLQQLNRLARTRSRTVLMSTHDPQHALTLNARVLVIDKGTLIADGASRQVLTGDLLSALYGTPVRVATDSAGRLLCYPELPADDGASG